jgi:hypothetical protein
MGRGGENGREAMNHEEAKNIIRETFQNTFDEGRFRLFAKNLFNDLDESKTFSYQGQYIPDVYKEHVRQYKRIGKYTDQEGTELNVLIVHMAMVETIWDYMVYGWYMGDSAYL